MREYFFRLLCDHTIEGPFTENGLKKAVHLANMMQCILVWISTFKQTLKMPQNWQKKVVYPKIDLVFHFGIFSFVLRERTTMARNMHVCYRYYVQANIEDASKSATIKYFFSFVFSGLRIWPLVTFWFNWFHFLAMMLMTRMMKLGDKIILVYLTSFHSAQHLFAAHWVYKSRTITHLLFLIFLHLICW